jgi:hypothetical protein
MSVRTIEQVHRENVDAWMALPGVIGTAIGRHGDRPCILILAEADNEQIRLHVPSTVEGYPVIIQHTGDIRALKER